MKHRTALKIGADCIRKEARRLYAFDANLYRKGVVKSVVTKRRHEQLKRLEDAAAMLEGEHVAGSVG